jgi:hypothetical protein
VEGLKCALAPEGIITMEFPHLLQLVDHKQFDTIYHEHFSYFSFLTVRRIFETFGLRIFDVEELSTHGGSLRIFACHDNSEKYPTSNNVTALLKKEVDAGMTQDTYYSTFQEDVSTIKLEALRFLIEKKSAKKKVAAYGAAAKGNTFLNYCGIKKDLIDFVVDRSPHKQNKFLPGSHIPIVDEAYLKKNKPDFVIILPWNLKDEVSTQLDYVREWGCKLVIMIPTIQVF